MNLKKEIRRGAERIFQASWYPNRKIILESIPDLGSQTYPVFEYMLSQGFNNKYKMIWFVTDKNKYKNTKIKNVSFQNIQPQNFFQKVERLYTLCTCRAMLFSHRYIGKELDKPCYFFLKHGSFIKSRLKHRNVNETNDSDFFINTSPFWDEIEVQQHPYFTKEQAIHTGYPTNDYLFDRGDYRHTVFPDADFDKLIVWLPTFRLNTDKKRVDSKFDFPLGIPILYTLEQMEKLNDVLRSHRVYLAIKPHPAQDVSVIKAQNFSNFGVFYDDNLSKANVHLYQLLASSDAMITDYSGVYYDYLLTDNSVGLTIDDYEEYKETTGFAIPDYFELVKGEYIRDIEDLKRYVISVAEGQDPYKEEREKVKNMIYDYCDAKSSERVYCKLLEEIEHRYGRV